MQSLESHDHYHLVPSYAIASHKWKRGTKATIEDVREERNIDKEVHKKVLGFAEYCTLKSTSRTWSGCGSITCCIKQDSDRELSDAIDSMFTWYRDTEICLAYLAGGM